MNDQNAARFSPSQAAQACGRRERQRRQCTPGEPLHESSVPCNSKLTTVTLAEATTSASSPRSHILRISAADRRRFLWIAGANVDIRKRSGVFRSPSKALISPRARLSFSPLSKMLKGGQLQRSTYLTTGSTCCCASWKHIATSIPKRRGVARIGGWPRVSPISSRNAAGAVDRRSHPLPGCQHRNHLGSLAALRGA
jgi:hypothetical protein